MSDQPAQVPCELGFNIRSLQYLVPAKAITQFVSEQAQRFTSKNKTKLN